MNIVKTLIKYLHCKMLQMLYHGKAAIVDPMLCSNLYRESKIILKNGSEVIRLKECTY